MKNFYDKIQEIQELLPNDKRIKNKLLLSCGIYYYIRLKVPLRAITSEIYSWSTFRHWIQRLDKLGLLNQIKLIVGGDSNESCQTSGV